MESLTRSARAWNGDALFVPVWSQRGTGLDAVHATLTISANRGHWYYNPGVGIIIPVSVL